MADLTNYGVQDPAAGETTYGPMAKIAKLVAALSAKTAQPQASYRNDTIPEQPMPSEPEPQTSPGRDFSAEQPPATTPADIAKLTAPAPNQVLTSPPASASPLSGATQFENLPAAPQPKVVKPSFQQASTDPYGNIAPGPGLTKLGRLLTILRGGIQGGIDAVAGGALDAVPGRSSFGAGAEAATTLPFMRARRIQEQQQGDAQTKLAQGEVQFLPFRQRLALMQGNLNLAHTQAQTNESNSKAMQSQAEAQLVPAQIATQNADAALKRAQAIADRYKESGGILYDTSGTTPVPISGGAIPLPADLAQAAGVPEQAGRPLPPEQIKRMRDAVVGDISKWDPIVVGQLGAPPIGDPARLADYSRQAEKIKTRMAAAPRLEMVLNKPTKVFDLDKQRETYVPADEAMGNHDRYLAMNSEEAQNQIFAPHARFQDMARVHNALADTAKAMDQGQGQKLLIGRALTPLSDSHITLDSLVRGFQSLQDSDIYKQLSPESRAYVNTVLSYREQTLALASMLGAKAGGSDKRTAAVWDTLPNGSEPDSKNVLDKLKLAKGAIFNLREAFPLMIQLEQKGKLASGIKPGDNSAQINYGNGSQGNDNSQSTNKHADLGFVPLQQ